MGLALAASVSIVGAFCINGESPERGSESPPKYGVVRFPEDVYIGQFAKCFQNSNAASYEVIAVAGDVADCWQNARFNDSATAEDNWWQERRIRNRVTFNIETPSNSKTIRSGSSKVAVNNDDGRRRVDLPLRVRLFNHIETFVSIEQYVGAFRQMQSLARNVGTVLGGISRPTRLKQRITRSVSLFAARSPLEPGDDRQREGESGDRNVREHLGPPVLRRFVLMTCAGVLFVVSMCWGDRDWRRGRQRRAVLIVSAGCLAFLGAQCLLFLSGFPWTWGWWL